jgi:hypothetical protein
MSVETLGEWLDRWREERSGPGRTDILEVEKRHAIARGMLHGLLDARIIRGACERCDGRRWIAETEVNESGLPVPVESTKRPCPDCPPPVVIAPEAVKQVVGAMAEGYQFIIDAALGEGDGVDRGMDAARTRAALHVIQTLYPGARVAREVGRVSYRTSESYGDRVMAYVNGEVVPPTNTIAILEED